MTLRSQEEKEIAVRAAREQVAEQVRDLLRQLTPEQALEAVVMQLQMHQAEHSSYNYITRDQLKLVAQSIAEQVAPLMNRVAALERRSKEAGGGGVVIRAENVSVDGMEQVAGMMSRLDATLRLPVKPIYGKDGMLLGARREALPGDESTGGGKPHLKFRDGTWHVHDRYRREGSR